MRSKEFVSDHVRSKESVYDHVRSKESVSDHVRSKEFFPDHVRSKESVYDHVRSKESVSDYSVLWNLFLTTCVLRNQCRINNGANGAAAPGPPQLGAPHKGFCFCTLIFLHTRSQTYKIKCHRFLRKSRKNLPNLGTISPPLKFCTRPPTLVIRHCLLRFFADR